MRTAAVASAGYDRSGDDIIDALKRDHVETKFIERRGREKTAYSTVLLSGIAERTILTYRGASSSISHAHLPWKSMNARLFYVSSLNGDLEMLASILSRAEKIKAKVFMNPGGGEFRQAKTKLLPLLARLDLLVMNREETAQLTGAPDAEFKRIVAGIRKINSHAIITDGRAGAYAVTSHDILHAAIVPVKRINLTGAGDAFGSAYAAAILAHRDLRSALAIGTLNATSVVQHTGAKVGILHGWPSTHEMAKVKIKKVIL
jgi:sugar/nucleoside kinase (ribokinase family)